MDFSILVVFCVHWSKYQPRVSEWFLQNGKYAQILEIACQEQISATCANQRLPGPCPSRSTRGSSHGHELDQGPTRRVEASERPQGLGRSTGSLPENLTADVHFVIPKTNSGKQLILHGNPSAVARDFSTFLAVFRRPFCRKRISNAVCYFKAPLDTSLTSLQPAVSPLPGCSS